MNYKYITVSFGALRKITGPPLQWQYNEKQYLIIKGLDLPDVYAVDFMNQGDTQTITMTPTAEGVLIPDQFLLDGRPLIAYIVVVDGESVNTIGQITFPVNPRGARTDMSPEPAKQQQIDQLIDTLNQAVSESQASAEESERQAGISDEHAKDSEAWAVGKRAGTDVETEDPTYHNNSKYYAGMAEAAAEEAGQHEASWETWVQRAETAADDAEGSARAAAGSKADAEAAAQTANQKAAAAESSATEAESSAREAAQTVAGGVGAINTARDGALTAIGREGTTQTGAVNQAGADQVTAVNQAGATQVQAVEDKGDEVLDSIPQDYTDLVDDVADLSRHLSYFDDIPGTVQSVNFGTDGKPSSVVHTKSGVTVRTDSFTWGTGTVTETRTLANGSYITMVTDLTTLVTTISEIQEAS